jgi:preprotein translocase subunit SecA
VYPIAELAVELVPLFDDPDTREQALISYAPAAPGKTSEKSVQKLFEKIDELAGGLDVTEVRAVAGALDMRLESEGLPRIFQPEDDEEEGEHEHVHGPGCDHGDGHDHGAPSASAVVPKVGRNDPCPCGSGKKFKKCHGAAN